MKTFNLPRLTQAAAIFLEIFRTTPAGSNVAECSEMQATYDPKALNALSYQIIAAAIEIHSKLGPGLLESVYRICMIHELRASGMEVAAEKSVPIHYKDEVLDDSYRIDLLVNDSIILELKAVDQILPVHRAQLLSYLRLTDKPLGLLVNFHVPKLVQGVCRMVNGPCFAKESAHTRSDHKRDREN